MNHANQTAAHRPFAATYADAATRAAATGFARGEGGTVIAFAAADLYKTVLQLDDNSIWILTATTPTWVQVNALSTEAVQDIVGALLTDSSEVDFTYNDGANTLSAALIAGSIADSKLTTPYIKADGTRAFTGDQSMGSHKLTNVTDPVSAQDAATKNYVDAISNGFDFKASCRVATTANITLSGTQTIDGVSVIAGNRVLVKNQSTGADNGIYVCAAGAWSRATDADASAEVTAGLFVGVTEGTANGDTFWVLTTNDAITLGSTSLTFTQYGATASPSGTAGGALGGTYPNPTVKVSICIAVSDETTDLTTGNGKCTFRMPHAMVLTEVRASLSTASSSGNPAIDVNEAGGSIFSTTLTIDSGEKTSTTAATPAVISDANLADDAEITIDIDTAGTGAKGLKIYLIGTRT